MKRYKILKHLGNLSIRSKLLIGYIAAFLLFLAISGLIIYPIMKKTIETNIESELNNTTKTILSMVKTSADASIKNYLRAVAEMNLEIVEQSYKRYQQGELSEREAKQRTILRLFGQRIGKTGYIYCIDSKGIMRVHPVAALLGADLSQYGFIQEQLKNKEGYIEYDWKNPGELRMRPKALYMTYFKPWDWIISASSYRDEFTQLVDMNNLRKSILSIRFGKTGYPFIIDSKGNIIVHPLLNGNMYDVKDTKGQEFVKEMIELKNGKIIYTWQNPNEKEYREKLVIFNYIPEFDWIVASSSYVDEFYEPLKQMRIIIMVIVIVVLLLLFLLTFGYSSYIMKSLNKIIEGFQRGGMGDFEVRIAKTSEDEMGMLSEYFNNFMGKLDTYNRSLQQEIKVSKRSEEELLIAKEKAEESQKKFKAIADTSPLAIYISEGIRQVATYINPTFFKIFGYSQEEVTEVALWWPLAYPDEAYQKQISSEWTSKVEKAIQTKSDIEPMDVIVTCKDGSKKNILWGFVSTGNENWAFGLDLTDIKQKTKELELAKERAEESDRLKSAFLANMSHEIRTPMNGILGFSELLKEPDLSGEEQQEYIKMIEKSGHRMLNIIGEIIDISKIESGTLKTNYTEINVNEKMEYVYNLLKPLAEDKNINLSFKNSLPTKETYIKTDNDKFYSILTNLLKNAIKYTDEGSVEFGINKKGNSLEFYVKDTGIGIPPERQEAIFERFIQAEITDIQARQGAGLGLSIAKAYVVMLGGEIRVESIVGKGSIFYFTLPFNTEPQEKKVFENDLHPYKTGKKVENLKILIAEDDEDSEILISIIIKEFSKEVINARTGSEAVELCRFNPDIDLILMDIRMPDLNGYEATRQIRQFNIKVIIIAQTAFGLLGDKEKAIDSGCNDYISKPIKKDELLALVNKYFNKY
ncbi:MAG: cache domain-containing protein [Salinivirgaceae bacterium]|nr:cache domain-containing protein [Salinivirgaceae bacterium]